MKKVLVCMLFVVIGFVAATFIMQSNGTTSANEAVEKRSAEWYAQARIPGTDEFREKLNEDVAMFQAKYYNVASKAQIAPFIFLAAMALIAIASVTQAFGQKKEEKSPEDEPALSFTDWIVNPNQTSNAGFKAWNGKPKRIENKPVLLLNNSQKKEKKEVAYTESTKVVIAAAMGGVVVLSILMLIL